MNISKTTTVVAAKNHVWCELADEAVVLHLGSSIYYGLNAVGARVWTLIQEPKTVDQVLQTLLDEYEVAPDQCGTDLMALLDELKTKDLIEISACG